MPTLSQMNIPPPNDWSEFEDIVLSCLKIKWASPNLTKHGRSGQRQQGVDIYGRDDLGRHVSVQCKKTLGDISLDLVNEEIEKAATFRPSLTALFIATTAQADAKIQQSVRLLSEQRVDRKEFPVSILFWEDLVSELVKNKEEFSRHYPELQLVGQPAKTGARGARLLSLLDLAYYGRHLLDFFDVIFGDTGRMSGETPQTYHAVLRTVENCASVLVSAERMTRFSALVGDASVSVGAAQADPTEAERCWQKAFAAIRSLQTEAMVLEPMLMGEELATYSVGATIGWWEWRDPNAKPVSRAQTDELVARVSVVIPSKQASQELEELLDEYHRLAAEPFNRMRAESTPDRVYGYVRNVIRLRELGLIIPES